MSFKFYFGFIPICGYLAVGIKNKALTNNSRYFIGVTNLFMQRDGALWGPTGKPVKFRYGPAAVFGDEIRNCHWSATKQIGKARWVDWSESQKTCHYVHVCGDGKSSSGYAWGFFFEQAPIAFEKFQVANILPILWISPTILNKFYRYLPKSNQSCILFCWDTWRQENQPLENFFLAKLDTLF